MHANGAAHEKRPQEVVRKPNGNTAPQRKPDRRRYMSDEREVQHRRYHNERRAEERNERRNDRHESPERRSRNAREEKSDAGKNALHKRNDKRAVYHRPHGGRDALANFFCIVPRERGKPEQFRMDAVAVLQKIIERDEHQKEAHQKLGDARKDGADVLEK